jgi:hypothetical protein
MLLDFVLFPLFLCVLYALGAGLLRARATIGEDYPSYFYFVAALLFIGFLSLTLNFFIGVFSWVTYAVLATVFLFGLTRLRRTDLAEIKSFLLFGLALATLTMAMHAQADTGLYHVPHQLWIRDEKIVLGLANFHYRLGFSSILEYISAPLWIGVHLKLLAYVLAAFVLILLLFLRDTVRSFHTGVAAFGFLTLLGLIINSNYFEFRYASTDTPTGILFALAFFQGLFLLLKEESVSTRRLSIFFILAVFAFTLKVSNAMLPLWVVFVVVMLLRAQRITLAMALRTAILPTLLTGIWLVRGFLLTGCLLYPSTLGCVRSVPWAAADTASQTARIVSSWAKFQQECYIALNEWWWFSQWWLPQNAMFCAGIIFVVAAVAFAYRALYKEKQSGMREVALPALGFVLLLLAVWFTQAPTPRFGIGMLIILPAVVAFALFGMRRPNPGFAQVLLWGLLGKFAFFGAYQAVRADDFSFNTLAVPAVETVAAENFGTRPKTPLCWAAKYCWADKRPAIKEAYGYKYFEYVNYDHRPICDRNADLRR